MAITKGMVTRSDFRELVRSSLKAAGLEDCAGMKNKDIDHMIAAVGDAVGDSLRRKQRVKLFMHDDKYKGFEGLVTLDLGWKAPTKGWRKGEKYTRRETPIAPARPDEVEVEMEDGSVMLEGKRQESNPGRDARWALKARAASELLDIMPAAPKRRPKS